MTEWKDEDEVTTTFRSLKVAKAEAEEAERNRIIKLIEAAIVVWSEVDPNAVRGAEGCLELICEMKDTFQDLYALAESDES